MMLRYGVLTSLLAQEEITEIMVNSWDRLFIEEKGVIQEVQEGFASAQEFLQLVQDIISYCGQRMSADSLFFDGVLPEGHRFNITLPPSSPSGPTLTIRKFNNRQYSLRDLVKTGSLNDKAARFLDAAVKSRLSIVVSGGTGTGKTTFLNSLASSIPGHERVITIQDIPELKLPIRNWVSMLTLDQPGLVTSRDCLINSLRMRPDRIIVGECRRDETFEMLQAMNTGHEGSMTTLHASSASEALTRIETLMMYARFEMPIKVLRYQISQSIDLIVQLRRGAKGQREVSEILEITGMEGDIIVRAPIFSRSENGPLTSLGYVPDCLRKIHEAKLDLPASFF